MKWSPPSSVTRRMWLHSAPVAEVLMTMSLPPQLSWKRQSDQATYTVPAASTSAEGSGAARSPPATLCRCTVATSTLRPQLSPPSRERRERICPSLLRYGTTRAPSCRTTGCPPCPLADVPVPATPSPLVEVRVPATSCPLADGSVWDQVRPPSEERATLIALPAVTSS